MPTSTIAEFIDQEIMVLVYCRKPGCRHMAEVDLDALAVRLGADRDLYARPPRWKCSVCGSGAEIRLSPPSSAWDLGQRRAMRAAKRVGTESPKPD